MTDTTSTETQEVLLARQFLELRNKVTLARTEDQRVAAAEAYAAALCVAHICGYGTDPSEIVQAVESHYAAATLSVGLAVAVGDAPPRGWADEVIGDIALTLLTLRRP